MPLVLVLPTSLLITTFFELKEGIFFMLAFPKQWRRIVRRTEFAWPSPSVVYPLPEPDLPEPVPGIARAPDDVVAPLPPHPLPNVFQCSKCIRRFHTGKQLAAYNYR